MLPVKILDILETKNKHYMYKGNQRDQQNRMEYHVWYFSSVQVGKKTKLLKGAGTILVFNIFLHHRHISFRDNGLYTSSGEIRLILASCLRISLWARTGTAIFLTSSGITKSLPIKSMRLRRT